MERPNLSGLAAYGGYRMASIAARGLPGFAAQALAPTVGLGANFASPQRRAVVAGNLRRADPTLGGLRLRRAVQEAFDSYARYWLESFRLPHLPARRVAKGMEVHGFEHVQAGLDAGGGVILALPHLGGWEWAGRWLADQGIGLTVVVEQAEPPELCEWFVDLRSRLGMNVVALGDGAAREVLAALGRNDIVCLLSDRDIQRTGVEVEFFGERTTMPPGPAMLSLRSGAPLLPTAVYFTDRTDGHLGIVRPPLTIERSGNGLRADVATLTQLLADELEHLIRRAPQQWHMMQPNWPSDPGYT